MGNIKVDRSSPILPIWYKNVRKEKDTEANALPLKYEPYTQLLLSKFRCGKKITAEEMNYIRKYAPDWVRLIERIVCERGRFDQGLKIAPIIREIDLTFTEHDQSQAEEKSNNGSPYFMVTAIQAYEQSKKVDTNKS